jgi:16S rRNA (guanine527-N7)-methyltransferase
VKLPRPPEPVVSRETEDKLQQLVGLLLRWSRSINLTAQADGGEIWRRHILDSLQLSPFLTRRSAPGIDLGSGAGFPGLVLAIATGWRFHLIEADQRKATFLREAARITSAPVTVHAQRIESLVLPRASVVTARALAPLPRLLELAAPFLDQNGVCLFLKGKTANDELTRARAEWHMQVSAIQSRTDSAACILQISEITRARQRR